jgi:hypothetical protein
MKFLLKGMKKKFSRRYERREGGIFFCCKMHAAKYP